MPSFTVENYLKAIHQLSLKAYSGVTANTIAESIGTKAATVSDMLRKLAARELVSYKKTPGYQAHRTEGRGKRAYKPIFVPTE